MARLYLEDFVVGQKYGTQRLRVDAEAIKAFAAAFDRSRSTSMTTRLGPRSSRACPRAAGTPPPSPCASWSRVT
jgi:hypothetical protein